MPYSTLCGAAALHTDTAPFSGAPALRLVQADKTPRITILCGQDWVEAAHAAHIAIRDSLPEDERAYLLLKDQAYFARALTDPSCAFVAAIQEDQIVGMAVLSVFPDYATALERQALTCPDADPTPTPIATLQTVSLLPAWQGHGLAKGLMKEADSQATQRNAATLFAQAAKANTTGCSLFTNSGFEEARTWTPAGSHTRSLFVKHLRLYSAAQIK